jgi:hypothetical protein
MLRGGCKSWGPPDLEATETKRGSDRNEAREAQKPVPAMRFVALRLSS